MRIYYEIHSTTVIALQQTISLVDAHFSQQEKNEIAAGLASSEGLKTTRHPSSIFASDYSDRRPGYYIQQFYSDKSGRDAMADVSGTHSHNTTNL